MRYLAGMFDAPIPAQAALSALASAGVPASDVQVIDPATSAPRALGQLLPPEEAARLLRALGAGFTVVLARVPTADAASVARTLAAVGALSAFGAPPGDQTSSTGQR